jgi:hypothetical protein
MDLFREHMYDGNLPTRQLIPNLPANSVVVIDNAPYHNKQQDKCPTSATTKREMQEWLRSKNIPFGNDLLKPQLYEVIKMNKPRYNNYLFNEFVCKLGFFWYEWARLKTRVKRVL